MSNSNSGIVLQHIRYGDSSLIVKIYTNTFGLQSFMIKGAFGRKSKLRPALFQPLSLISFEANIHPSRELQFMSEATIETPFYSFTSNVKKSTIVIYISELLSRSLRENVANDALFTFIRNSLEWLDLSTDHFADFHLFFTLELSRYLGFFPKVDSYASGFAFDLMDGEFKPAQFAGPHMLSPDFSNYFFSLCNSKLENLSEWHFTKTIRKELLQQLITYYQLHLPGFGGLHAHEVLSQLLS